MEEIFVPASGMAMEDVLFVEWLKAEGEEVGVGEAVAVVETDKSTLELSATTAGRLSHHLVAVGSRVLGGTTVAWVLAEGETAPGTNGSEPEGREPEGRGPAPSSVASVPRPPEPAPVPGTEPALPEQDADGRHRLSPRQRRAVAAAASEPNGAVQGGESPAVASAPSAAAPPSADRARNREATAALVSESWRTIPHFSVGRDVRADGLSEAVGAARAAGATVTVTDFLVLALARALEQLGERPDVGLAVATDWGVLIPVVRSLDGLSVREVAPRRAAAVARARNRRLESSDTTEVFATLSNLGTAGVTWFTGVVPLNQVALLTVGEVSLRPVVEGRGLLVAPVLTAIVTADHRRYDGVDSAKLLGSFADHLRAVIAEEQQ